MLLKEMYKDFMKEAMNNPGITHRACTRLCKTFKRAGSVILILSLINALSGSAQACEYDCSFDITQVSDISTMELYEFAPDWCDIDTCRLIFQLSNEYGISSEFALSVFRYEYVPERNSVGGVKKSGEYAAYNSLEESIRDWFEFMSETYCNEDSWHYGMTGGTTIHDIAPMYNQGETSYNYSSENWCRTIEKEVQYLLQSEK